MRRSDPALTSLDHPGLLPAALLGEPRPGNETVPRSLRDWIADALAFLLSLGLGWAVLSISLVDAPASGTTVLIDVVLGCAGCLSLWWRRRWPVQIGLFTAALGAVSMFSAAAGTIALFTVAVHRSLSRVLLVVLAGLAGTVLLALLRPDHTSPLWVDLVIGILITSAAVAWGMMVRARRQVLISLQERAERAESEQRLRVSRARHMERTRIAREMHDVLAHRISLISVHAGALEFSAGATPQDVAGSAAVIRRSAHHALEDLREILGVLRADQQPDLETDPIERPQPTLADLPGLVEQSRSAGMNLTISDRLSEPDGVPTSLARTAFRVIQEGLTNARKHAPHTAVTVRLDGGPGPGLDVEVRNRVSVLVADGSTRTVAALAIPGAGQGLAGLAERVSLIGGRLEHGPGADGDFHLHAWLPWPA